MIAGQPNGFCLLARWTARIVSLLLVLMVLTILVGEGPPRPASWTWTLIGQFAAFGVVLAGLLAAWRWELAGAMAALIGLGVFEGIEFAVRRGFAFGAFPWFAVPAVLYLLASWSGRRPFGSRLRGC
jgi:hypothetical protein